MGVTSHGMSNTATYRSWGAMVQRCTNPKNPAYHDYGGRGITCCARWMSFENFLADMGVKPDGLTLERKDNDGHYDVGNCRWATRAEQNRNSRHCRLLTHGGETLRIGEWAKRLGISEPKLRDRLNKGWPLDKALTLPPSKHNSVARKKLSAR